VSQAGFWQSGKKKGKKMEAAQLDGCAASVRLALL
jgi:hypothetical protein